MVYIREAAEDEDQEARPQTNKLIFIVVGILVAILIGYLIYKFIFAESPKAAQKTVDTKPDTPVESVEQGYKNGEWSADYAAHALKVVGGKITGNIPSDVPVGILVFSKADATADNIATWNSATRYLNQYFQYRNMNYSYGYVTIDHLPVDVLAVLKDNKTPFLLYKTPADAGFSVITIPSAKTTKEFLLSLPNQLKEYLETQTKDWVV